MMEWLRQLLCADGQVNWKQWNNFNIAMDWEGDDQERNLSSKIDTFRLNWNLQLSMWTTWTLSGEMFYGQTRQSFI